jgi:hypothetical protein
MELFETNEELEAFMPSFAKKDGERWIREDEVIIDDPEQDSDYDSDSDWDNVKEFDPSEFEGLSTEDLSPEEEAEFELFAPNDYKLYITNKIYKSMPTPPGSSGKVVDMGKAAFRRLSQKGFDPKVLSAIIGNGIVESNLNPAATGDKGTAFGINQNRFEKADYFNREYSKLKSVPESLDKHIIAQYKSVENNYPKIFNKVKQARNYSEGSMIYGREYEKPKYLKNDRGSYGQMVTMQSGGDFEDLPVYQTFGQTQSPFSWNGSGPYPYTFNKGHINYSPVSQPGVPATYTPMDATKAWSNKNHMSYSNMPAYDQEHYNLETDLMSIPGYKPYETPQISETQSLQLSGLNNDPIPGIGEAGESSPKFGVDDATKLINTGTGLLNDVRDWRNIIGKGMQSGLAGATSIFSNLENDRLQRKSLKNMYKESIRDYYKTSFGFK